MRIRVLCIGKLKERFYVDAALEFQKRLSRYASVELVELADARAPEQLSAALYIGGCARGWARGAPFAVFAEKR